MKDKLFLELSNEELLEESTRLKSSLMLNAFFIGFLVTIVVFSIVKQTFGLVSIIPLYFIYRLLKNNQNKKAATLNIILKDRGLT
jgi:cbb3-type cytochrome oxidase subunit 3